MSKVAAAGYLLAFYNDIENLTNNFSNYTNLLAELKEKYPTEDSLRKMSEEDNQASLILIKNLRFWVTRSYIKYMALKSQIKEFQAHEKIINQYYNELINQNAFKIELLQAYAIKINELFVNGVTPELLTTSTDLYAKYLEPGEQHGEPGK